MEQEKLPHQIVINSEGIQFFSDFDSGNLMRAVKVGHNQVRIN
jgi:hypothetical protein